MSTLTAHEGPCHIAVMSGGQMSCKVSRTVSTTLGFVSMGCDILCGKFSPSIFLHYLPFSSALL